MGFQGLEGFQGSAGVSGNVGPQGYSGFQGGTGFQGQMGVVGSQGNSGPQGLIGIGGPQGETGQEGSVGSQGQIGPQGVIGQGGSIGAQGESGPQGGIGQMGLVGSQGQIGPQGWTGQGGSVGPQGQSGPQGETGQGGSVGTQGEIGPQGWTGQGGSIGPQGQSGPQGEIGQIGSIGSQGQIGPQGGTGQGGSVGPQGQSGTQGGIGQTGLIGPQGQSGPQGGIGQEGSIGPQGQDGTQGEIGYQGIVGTQGNSGQIGPQGVVGKGGDVGPQGVIGFQGASGVQGTVGSDGSLGPQGLSGGVGHIGPQGQSGVQGSAGSSGGVGPQGLFGEQGFQGPCCAGPQGLIGFQGVVGPQGFVGPSDLPVNMTAFVDQQFATTPGVVEDMTKPFATINDALFAIQTARGDDTTQRWLVVVRPGTYTEVSSFVQVMPNVDIAGSGPSTIINAYIIQDDDQGPAQISDAAFVIPSGFSNFVRDTLTITRCEFYLTEPDPTFVDAFVLQRRIDLTAIPSLTMTDTDIYISPAAPASTPVGVFGFNSDFTGATLDVSDVQAFVLGRNPSAVALRNFTGAATATVANSLFDLTAYSGGGSTVLYGEESTTTSNASLNQIVWEIDDTTNIVRNPNGEATPPSDPTLLAALGGFSFTPDPLLSRFQIRDSLVDYRGFPSDSVVWSASDQATASGGFITLLDVKWVGFPNVPPPQASGPTSKPIVYLGVSEHGSVVSGGGLRDGGVQPGHRDLLLGIGRGHHTLLATQHHAHHPHAGCLDGAAGPDGFQGEVDQRLQQRVGKHHRVLLGSGFRGDHTGGVPRAAADVGRDQLVPGAVVVDGRHAHLLRGRDGSLLPGDTFGGESVDHHGDSRRGWGRERGVQHRGIVRGRRWGWGIRRVRDGGGGGEPFVVGDGQRQRRSQRHRGDCAHAWVQRERRGHRVADLRRRYRSEQTRPVRVRGNRRIGGDHGRSGRRRGRGVRRWGWWRQRRQLREHRRRWRRRQHAGVKRDDASHHIGDRRDGGWGRRDGWIGSDGGYHRRRRWWGGRWCGCRERGERFQDGSDSGNGGVIPGRRWRWRWCVDVRHRDRRGGRGRIQRPGHHRRSLLREASPSRDGAKMVSGPVLGGDGPGSPVAPVASKGEPLCERGGGDVTGRQKAAEGERGGGITLPSSLRRACASSIARSLDTLEGRRRNPESAPARRT